MKREWQPGDVALVTYGGMSDRRICTWATACKEGKHPTTAHWHVAWTNTYFPDVTGVTVRPLVVIDPEDHEQVEWLIKTAWPSGHMSSDIDKLQAALREFADPKPPKPEEPLGLGAVVEDSRGEAWINWRDPRRSHTHERPWVNSHDSEQASDYADLDVVRVLSDGWVGEDR